MKVIECEARDIQVGDVLVNLGEVVDVHGSDDTYLIEVAGQRNRMWGIAPKLGKIYRDIDTVFRFKREGENPNRYAAREGQTN